jgi:hypothetical protein
MSTTEAIVGVLAVSYLFIFWRLFKADCARIDKMTPEEYEQFMRDQQW